MKKSALISLLTAMLLAAILSACNTTKGAGKDMERGGEKLQNSAERHGAQ
jgi:entericidin B